MKNVQTKKKIRPEDYVNIITGEPLDSEYPELQTVNLKTGFVIMDYKEYIIIDSLALIYIQNNFSTVDFGRITHMANMVKGTYNILHDRDGNAQTEENLMIQLNLTRNRFADFIKRLLLKEVIFILIGFYKGKKFKKFILNPFLARKTKIINKEILQYFSDIRNIKQ